MKALVPAPGFTARWKQGVSVTWPLLLGSLSSLLLTAVDTALLGHWSTSALSAMAIAGSLVMVVTAVLTPIGTATQIVTAQWVGAGRGAHTLTVLRLGVRYGVATAFPAALALAVLALPVLALVGGDVARQVEALPVLLWLVPSIPLAALAAVYRGWIVGLGATRVALGYAVLVNGVNIVLDAGLVFGAGLGAVGSSLGSTAAVAVGLVFVVARARRHVLGAAPCDRRGGGFSAAGEIRRIAWPDMVFGAASYGADVAIVSAVSSLAATDVAAYRVMSTTVAILFVVGYSVSNALGVLVGQRLGAGDRAGARAWVWPMSVVMAQALLLVGLWPMLASSRWFALFSGDSGVVEAVASLSWVWGGVIVGMGISLVLAGIIRAGGDTRSMMWIGIVSQGLIAVSLTWLLAVHAAWGLVGVATAVLVGWLSRAILSGGRAKLGLWRELPSLRA